MHRDVYHKKADNYMDKNTKNHNYFKCSMTNLVDVRKYIEEKYDRLKE